MKPRTLGAVALLYITMGATPAMADDISHVFGWIEKVSLVPWGVELKAKMDSGALTSSMHATDIERFERDDEEWVRFTVEVEDEGTGEVEEREFEKPVYRNVIIRGAGGEERRPVVLMRMCLGETVYEEQFSLEDRSDMIYPLLIGRRTIQHIGLIDVTQTFITDPDCEEEAPVREHDERPDDDDIGA